MGDILRKCVEFVLISLLMLIAGVVVILSGMCLIIFSPIIALYCAVDERYVDEEFSDGAEISE